MWRAVGDLLHSAANLERKGMMLDIIISGWSLKLDSDKAWISEVMKLKDEELLEKFPILLWANWNMRNRCLFERLHDDLVGSSNRALRFLFDYQSA
ncbi:conserved hypothetical protein [Ricinus communis]|uniref:Uncharacterized protein n=1 Tax=Ricinus communis TaxID=3988 RepID=B9SEK6_RICCO|nr:conserved hypothetical protein [Ricinus communis]